MQFKTIASGSSGNAYYLGLAGKHFLIDAGVSGKRIQNALYDINVHSLDAIFITHEHRDHITGAGVLARKFKTDIYATPYTWRYFLRHGVIGTVKESQVKFIEQGCPVSVGNVEISAFDIAHDASQPVGYTFCCGFEKLAFATDLGHVTESVKEHLKGARILLLESNYDPEMLAKGRYHAILKERVASNRGHLSNAQAGMILAEVVVPSFTHVFLAHLSEENNTPMLAFDTVKRVLDANDVTVLHLEVAERHIPGELIVYE
ncbi:MAG: MBL fold metallo-hydrolase [Defluviitaleaceae bacterium]|nr:MBL fold metallo-hydrolase [Defluviitaleaceae bacterium]